VGLIENCSKSHAMQSQEISISLPPEIVSFIERHNKLLAILVHK